MAVIKACAVQRVETGTLKAFRLDDVTREAREAMVAAHARAEALLKDAETRASQIRKSAEEAGYKAGFESGLQAGRDAGRRDAYEAACKEFAEKQQGVASMCREVIASVEADRATWAASARQDLIELAMAIARRVAHHVGEREREVVLANLEEAVRLTGARSDVTIAVHPADAETTRLFAKSLLDLKEQWEHVRVVEEPEVAVGGCRVQWGSGAVDATLDTQLDRIEAALREGQG
jgi:flagellar assembly protein FliH